MGRHGLPPGNRRRSVTRRITAAVTALLLGLVGVVVGTTSAFASEGAGINLSGDFMGGYIIEAGPNAGRQVFCIDAGRAEPGPGIDYSSSALGGSQQAAYLLGHYGNTTDGTTGAALSYIIARDGGLPHDNAHAPGFDNPGAGVLDRVAQLQAEAAAYAGPYTLTPANVTNPTAASGTVVKRFRLTSSAGNPMQGVAVTFAATGSATGMMPGSASTNANGEVTVTYQLANSTTGGVSATASGLYSNVTVYTPVGGGNYQRLVGTGAPGSVQGSATATRPAEPTGRVRIFKQSTGGGAGLGGAEFEVRQGSTVVESGTTGSNGWTPWLTVNTGSYTIVETAAPSGFNRDAPNQSLTVTAGGDHEVTMQDSPQGRVSVIKTDAATGNRLAGATFEVVRGGTVLATGTTNSNGEWTSGFLGGGTKVGDQVTIRETAAPAGYQTVGQQTVTVTRDGSATARWTVADPRVFGNAAVAKVDSVTGAPLPGATFTAEVRAVASSTWAPLTGGAQSGTTEPSPGEYVTNPTGRVVIDGTASSPQFHYGDQIRFTETATAAGYVLPVEPLVVTGTIGVDGTLVVNGANSPERTVQVAKTAQDGGPMEGVSFTVCYSSDGRALLPGEADARTACEVPAGTGIGGVDDLTGWYLIDNSLVTGADGRTAITDPSPWIQPGDSVAVFETVTPHGYQWQSDAWVFDVTASGYTTPAGDTQDSTLVAAAVVNELIQIGTTAFTDQGKTVPVGGGTVTDTIAYEGLIPGEFYTARGIINQIVDGDVTATDITGETTFIPESTDGTVDVVFEVPAELVGSVLVVFEEVYRDSTPDTPVAEHENPEDTDQIVYFPSVGTSALNADDTLGKIVAPGATVIDTVTVCAAQPGEYLLTGTATATGPDGQPYDVQVAGTTRITVTSTDCADYTVEFLLSEDIQPGTALVFAETLYQVPDGVPEDWAPEDGDLPEGVHDDPTDEAQTVYHPVIGTNAADTTTLSQNISTGSLTDTVSYTNLQPGVEYTVTGTLLVAEGELPPGFDAGQPEDDADDEPVTGNPDEGETVSDPDEGEPAEPGSDDELVPTPTGITVTTTFTPISPSGTVDVVFDVPAELAGLVLVAYEQVALSTLPDVPVASHEDPTDTNQYGWVPEIGTTAGNAIEDLGKTVNPGGTLIDTVEFEGLQPGKEYRLTGEFQVVIDGKITATGITGDATFTPETAAGTVDVEFSVPDADALAELDLVGRDIVAFEQLWEGDVLIAIHADIDDEGQTTEVPSIGTEAGNADDDYGKIVTPDGTLIDRISYTNLRPGVEYTAVGEFQIIVDGKATPSGIDGTATFTPTTPDGEVVVEFTVPAEVFAKVAGSTLVAFETVSQGDVLVAIHADVTDQAQTVYVPVIGTTATDKADGDKTVDHDGVVVDVIAYCGLEPGVRYTALGELQQVDADGTATATGITGKTTFTAGTPCGEAVVEFQLDGSIQGKTVVFERLVLASDEDLVVATHEDATDEGQTVEIAPEGSVTGGVVNGGGGIPSGEGAAGGPNSALIWSGIGLVVAAGLALILLSAHRRREAARTLIPQGV